ncbi:MAG: rod shape-determining protein MreD [Treponema sp.]|nr:rod shape-determining protein MreD [Treponema sp.]
MIKAFLSSIFILFCSSLIESALLSNLTFLPAVPDFSLLCVIYLGFHNGRIFGEVSGFASGLMLDFLSASPFGLNCLLRTLCGYTSGLLTKTLNTEGTFIPCLLGFFATIFKMLLVFLISLLFPATVNPYRIISWTVLFELAFNTFFAPVVFKFLSIFRKTLYLSPETVI